MDIKTRNKLIKKISKCIPENESDCWIWYQKTRRKEGYGQVTFIYKGKRRYTSPHRLAQILFKGRVDLLESPELFVCHLCDNKDCINPRHTFVGTWLDNAMDDVLRNEKVGPEFSKRIVEIYRERNGLRPCHDVRKHYLKRRGLTK